MRKSFTLIELIVVIAIIAVLAAIIAPNAFKAIEKAKISRTIADFKTIKSATQAYYADVGKWPPKDLTEDPLNPNIIVETENFISGENQPLGWDGPYLERWPQNPFFAPGRFGNQKYSNYIYIHTTDDWPWGHPPGTGLIYLQVGHFPIEVARKIKQKMDGTDNLGSPNVHGYGDEPGSIRWHCVQNYLYYVIEITGSP